LTIRNNFFLENFRSLKTENVLFSPSQQNLQENLLWTGKVEKFESEPYEKNEFLRDLEEEENIMVDF